MRKEYTPAMILYAISAILFIASAVCAYFINYHWATVGLFAVVMLLFASSILVKTGKKLREDEERGENEDKE
jgi:uncharacterized membrane protein